MCRTDQEIIKEIKWRKHEERDCKAIFYLGEGWLRIDYAIEGRVFNQQLIMDVYLGKDGNLEFT